MRFGHRFDLRYQQKSALAEDLIVAWPLDEASGTRYPYYGGTEFNLTDVNTVGTADAPPGIGGRCANFDGSTEYLYCADPFAPPSALTVSAWVYQPGGISTKIIAGVRGAAGTFSWGLYLATLTPRFFVSANGTAITEVNAAAISGSTWTLLTAVWTGASLLLYKDLTPGSPAAFSSALFDSTEPLSIGAGTISTTPAFFFGGRIAQPLIWSRAIAPSEIAYLYNSGNGRPLTDWL